MMPAWTYLIADLSTNNIIDELPLSSVRMSKVLNGAGQLQAQVKLGDVSLSARNVYDLTRPVRRVVYALRDNRPWWGGIIWASDYDSATETVDIGCADFWSYFDHRKVLEVLPALPLATSYVAGLSMLFAQVEQNDIARSLVTTAQAHTSGDIGIVVDSAVTGVLRDRQYDGFELQDVGEMLRDLAGIIDGPDTNGRPIRIMRTGTPRIGQQGTPHRWDLGGNMLSYKWSSGGGVMATRVFAEGDGTDRGTKIAVAEETEFYANGWPLLDTDDVYEDVVVDATLLEKATGLLDGLKLPLVGLEIRVRGDRFPTIGDFGVGDTGVMVVPVRDLLFTAGIEAEVRVLSLQVSVTDEGDEDVAISCQAIQEIV